MDERNLKITESNGLFYARFNSNGARKTRLLTQEEAKRAQELIARQDAFAIDQFCYRIA